MKKVGSILSVLFALAMSLVMGNVVAMATDGGLATMAVTSIVLVGGGLVLDKAGMMKMGYSMCLTLVSQTGPNCMTLITGGTAQKFYYGYYEDFSLLNRPKRLNDTVPPTTPDQLTKITVDHTWTGALGVYEFYSDAGEGQVVFDSNSKEITYTGFFPGIGVTDCGDFVAMGNARAIAFIPMPNGDVVQIGSSEFPAELSYKTDTKKKATDKPGTEVTIKAIQPAGFIFYQGDLTIV